MKLCFVCIFEWFEEFTGGSKDYENYPHMVAIDYSQP